MCFDAVLDIWIISLLSLLLCQVVIVASLFILGFGLAFYMLKNTEAGTAQISILLTKNC